MKNPLETTVHAIALTFCVWGGGMALASESSPSTSPFGPYCDLEDHEEVFTLAAEGIQLSGGTFCRFAEPLAADSAYDAEINCQITMVFESDGAEFNEVMTHSHREHLTLEPDPERGTISFRIAPLVAVETLHCHAVWPL